MEAKIPESLGLRLGIAWGLPWAVLWWLGASHPVPAALLMAIVALGAVAYTRHRLDQERLAAMAAALDMCPFEKKVAIDAMYARGDIGFVDFMLLRQALGITEF